ncbi:hypothetical protein ACFQXB_16410 [Plastorhodobacter daqingensis]|uniref:Uncharacterized protein n=1 Tax=Plastorhodobacter daqingensis TaxID=1387281 RepID=A0ABW2URC0_9RHOB
MSLPKRALFTLSEAAARWGCQVADIAEWALSGHLEIMTVIPLTRFGDAVLSDRVVIAPGDIMAVFRRCGTGPHQGIIRRARALGSSEWRNVSPPESGLAITRDDLVLSAACVARFEEEHGVFRRVNPNASKGHDWEGFYGALILHLFQRGLPEKQADLVGEMQDWFIANSTDGDAPEESTIRKRVSPILRMLHAEA